MKVAPLPGGDGSAFTVHPEYKIRSEGSGVFSGDHIQLLNKKLDYYLHHSLVPGTGVHPPRHEVNLSVQDRYCGWQIHCYTRYVPGIERLLCLGQTVRLLHPEAEASNVAENSCAVLLRFVLRSK